MKRKRRAAAPLRRGPAVLLGDGCLLLLVLAGTVFSFLTAFSVQIHALPLLLGCAAAALAFLGLWSLPRRWWALPLALLACLELAFSRPAPAEGRSILDTTLRLPGRAGPLRHIHVTPTGLEGGAP